MGGGKEVWINDIRAIELEAECFRAELVSGGKPFVLRGTRATLVGAVGKAVRAIETAAGAEVVQLRKR